MLTHDRSIRLLAACLSAVAGYVDALGFLAVGGFFVSFMSGNSTRLGVGLAARSHDALIAMGLVTAFIGGVALGSLVGLRAEGRRRCAVLVLVAGLLALAAVLSLTHTRSFAIGVLALAMGAENAVFERDGEVSIGLTYMTGTLVKAGQRISAALLGGDPFAFAPYLLLWAGLVAGAALGAAVYPLVGLQGLWIAVAAVAILAFVTLRLHGKDPSKVEDSSIGHRSIPTPRPPA